MTLCPRPLLGLAACLALPALAQATATTAATDSDTRQQSLLPEVIVQEKAQEIGYQPKRATTATRTDAALRDLPQAVAVVPAQVLQDQQVRNIDEALYYVSGITQANTLGGTQDALIKRGFGFNRDGSILRDGVRTVLARNLTYTTDRVEVLKGPSSILYGSMDPGGVINMVTKKPQLEFAGQAGLSVSSYGGGGASVDLTGPLGDKGLAYRLIADTSKVDYWRNFGVNKQTVIAPSLAWYGRDSYVRVSYEHSDYEQPFDRGTVIDKRTGKPVDIDPRRRLDEAYNRTLGDSDFFTVQGQHTLSPQWKLGATYSYNRNRYDDYQARPVSLNPVTGVLTRRPDGTRGAVSQQHVAQFNLQGSVQWGGLRHDILTGLDLEDSDIYRRDLIRGRNNSGFNVYDPVYGQMPNSTSISATDSDQSDKTRQQALFFQDNIRLGAHWIAQAGGRWLHYKQEAGKGRPFQVNSASDGWQFVPRVGLVWQPDQRWSVYGNYSESFKPQSSVGTLLVGALPPEEAKSWELGAKLELARGITATAAVYDIRKRNVQGKDVVDGETITRVMGGARSRGLELDIAGQLSRQWQIIGSYAYTDAWVSNDPQYQGNRLANVARQSASLFAAYSFPRTNNGQWRTGAGVRHVGKRAGDSKNSFDNDAYNVTDAFVSYETQWNNHPLRLQLNIKNLFDKTYVASSGSDIYVSLGERRQAVLRAVLDF